MGEVKKKLIELAKENPGIRNRYKMAAGITYKKKLLSVGINQRKTHPIMCNHGYKEEQIYLHAEADAIRNFLNSYDPNFLSNCALHVVRVKKDPDGNYVESLAKPCNGCMNLIYTYNIKEVTWTID